MVKRTENSIVFFSFDSYKWKITRKQENEETAVRKKCAIKTEEMKNYFYHFYW